MRKSICWAPLLVFFLALGTFWAQEKKPEGNPAPATAAQAAPAAQNPHTFNISKEDSERKNPVRFSELSVGRGKKDFVSQCSMCHGETGDGKGDPDLLKDMKVSPPDFTKAETLKNRTDGDLFAIITSGSDTMPGQATRLKDRTKWDIVNYLRAVGGKVPLKAVKEEQEEGTAIVKSEH